MPTFIKANVKIIMNNKEVLKKTWEIVKGDLNRRTFTTHPYLAKWIDSNLEHFLETMSKRIKSKADVDVNRFCFSPKSDICIRRGSVLTIQDAFFYTYAVKKLYQKIYKRVEWTQGEFDLSYKLQNLKHKNPWVPTGLTGWKEFPNKTCSLLKEKDFPYVIFLDIAACYDNINHRLLGQYLEDITNSKERELVRKLMDALGIWSRDSGKGLPQGYTASDVLAKIYFEKIHKRFIDKGIQHIRYVDDFRIFCNSEIEARKQMIEITEILSECGFSIQTHKTELQTKEDALKKINTSLIVIKNTIQKLKEDSSYKDISDENLEKLIDTPNSEFTKILQKTFKDNFNSKKFVDKSLYHYLVSRLGRQKSKVCKKQVLRIIQIKPEETKYSLIYLTKLYEGSPLPSSLVEFLINHMESDNCFYEYQKYEILKFLYENKAKNKHLKEFSEKIAKDKNYSSWVRSYAIAIWMQNNAPKQELLDMYSNESDDIIKSDILQAYTQLSPKEYPAVLKRYGKKLIWRPYIETFSQKQSNQKKNHKKGDSNLDIPYN